MAGAALADSFIYGSYRGDSGAYDRYRCTLSKERNWQIGRIAANHCERERDRVWLAGKQRLASFYQRIPDESTTRGRVGRDRDAISRCGFFYFLLDTGRTFEPDRSGAGKDGGAVDGVMRWRGGEGWKYGGRCWRRWGRDEIRRTGH